MTRRSTPYLLFTTMAVLAALATFWSWQQAHATCHSIGVVTPVSGIALGGQPGATVTPALAPDVGAWSHISA